MTTPEATYEHHFVTNDGPIFNLIEDEDGGTYWGYGHVEPQTFITEVNRWLTHCGLYNDDLAGPDTKVDHLWARYSPDTGEFHCVDKPWMGTKEAASDLFPVTRVWL